MERAFPKRLLSVLTLVFFCMMPCTVYAQDDDYLPEITYVDVRGNVVVSTQTILNKIKSREGQTLSREMINQDIKRLYSTGYFRDVKVDLMPDGSDYQIIFIVDEKPVIKTIEIEGARLLKRHTLLKEIGLREGQVLDRKMLKDGIHNIELRYKKKGYRFVEVTEEVRIDELRKEVLVRVIIDEGKKFKIKDISFVGNEYYSDKELLKTMRTKKDSLIRSGAFDEFRFEDDIERLKSMHQREGFLDVAIDPAVNYDNATNAIFLEITIREGAQYRAGQIRFEGNVLFPKMEIMERLTILPGSVFSPLTMQDDLNRIRKYYFERGHIDADVEPQVEYNRDNAIVDVLYTIREGSVFNVDKIRIRGNTKTKDIVIRRELRVYPGERFDGEKLERSKQRLKDLGFFEDVQYETEPGSTPDSRDLIFKVKEKQTGEFSFGGGVSSLESYLGFVELSQNNFDLFNWPRFTGGGQRMSIRGRYGEVSQDIDISFFEPYILNKPYSLGVHFYKWKEDVDELDWATDRLGGSITLGKNFTDNLKGSLSYNLENVEMEDIETDAHSDVLNTNHDAWLSKVKASISYDRRNSRVNPTEGYMVSFSSGLVGGALGGDEDYYELEATYNHYWTFFDEHLLQLRTRAGVMDEYGDSDFVPVYDRFYAGGLGSVRGYSYRRVSPKGTNDSPIGGETLVLASLEYQFPIIDNFKGAVFIDAGHVNYDALEVDTGDFAVSIGPGLLVNTPIGPIALYYGYPIANEDSKDENGRLEFSFSRGF